MFFHARYYYNMLVSNCIRRYLRQCILSTAANIAEHSRLLVKLAAENSFPKEKYIA